MLCQKQDLKIHFSLNFTEITFFHDPMKKVFLNETIILKNSAQGSKGTITATV